MTAAGEKNEPLPIEQDIMFYRNFFTSSQYNCSILELQEGKGKSMKIIKALLLVLLLGTGFVFPSTGSCGILLKIGAKYPESSLEGQSIKKVAALLSERSGGRLELVPYFSESLGNADTQFENVMLGTQDMYMESYSFFQSWVPEMMVHTIPYLFRDAGEYRNFLLSGLEKEFEAQLLAKTGMRIIGSEKNWIRGPYRVLVSRHPVITPKDLKGLKLRMSESRMNAVLWSALGARVTVIPWTEVYLALKQGVVEAASSTMDILYGMKFTEICKHVTRTDENRQQLAFVINERKFQSLGPELQKLLDDVFNEIGEIHSPMVEEEARKSLEQMKQEHGIFFHEPDLASWHDATGEALAELEREKIIPPGLLVRVEAWKASLKGQ